MLREFKKRKYNFVIVGLDPTICTAQPCEDSRVKPGNDIYIKPGNDIYIKPGNDIYIKPGNDITGGC